MLECLDLDEMVNECQTHEALTASTKYGEQHGPNLVAKALARIAWSSNAVFKLKTIVIARYI